MRKKLIFVFMVLSVALTACAPKVQKPAFEQPKSDFAPKNEDSNIREQEITEQFHFDNLTVLDNRTSVAAIYQLSENIFELGLRTGNQALQQTGANLILKNQKNASFAAPIIDTPYMKLLEEETRQQVQEGLTKLEADLAQNQITIQQIIQRQSQLTQWPHAGMKPMQLVQFVVDYLNLFSAAIQAADLIPQVKQQIAAEVRLQQQYAQGLGAEVQEQINSNKNLLDFISYLEQLMIREKMDIPAELQKTLTSGKDIGHGLLQCQSAQSALSVIVDVWILLEQSQREEYFKPVSKELFDLLDGKSEKDLKCLKDENCKGLLRDLVKSLFILPKLEKYGVGKICNELNHQALTFAQSSLDTELSRMVLEMPQMISDSVSKSFSDKVAQIRNVRLNYKRFLQDRVDVWSKKTLNPNGVSLGLETSKIKTSLKQGKLSLTAEPGPATSEGLGASFSAFQQLWSLRDLSVTLHLQSGIEMVNRIAALTGYRYENKQVPALLMPLDVKAPLLDIRTAAGLPQPYAMTDEITLKGYAPVPNRVSQLSLSAKSQAELVRGLSQIFKHLRDWESSSFDSYLGQIKANDLVPEYGEIPELQEPLFPKEDLMALTLGGLAVTLQNLTKAYSQFFLVGLNNTQTWLNEFNFETGDTAVTVGVVDIEKGLRKKTVSSESVSRWIWALSEFLNATHNIESTKSSYLLQPDAQGKKSLDAVLDARKQIKLLVVGLSNFLSHEMVAQGYVVSSLEMPELKVDVQKQIQLMDQFLAIRALLRASEATKLDVYRVIATEIYYNLNNKAYRPKLRFYSPSENTDKIQLPVLVEGLRTLMELKPYLPEKSQHQLQWIVNPWLKPLSQL